MRQKKSNARLNAKTKRDCEDPSCEPIVGENRWCFSTLNHIVAYVYNNGNVIKWIVKNALKNGLTKAEGTVE